MSKLRKKKLLVGLHVLSVMAWFGGTMSLLLLLFYMRNADSGEQLFYTLANMHVIDGTLVRLPALAVLISGVALSLWPQRGLVRYHWVLIKLVLTVVVILTGIVFINDWFSFLIRTAEHYGSSSLQRQDFQTTSSSLILAAIFNNVALGIMAFVTSFKPFGKIRR